MQLAPAAPFIPESWQGRRLAQLPVQGEHAVDFLRVPGDDAGRDEGPDLVQEEAEAGDGAEVAATAAQSPEEISVLVRPGPPQLPVGGHDVDLLQVVDGPPKLPAEVTETPSEGEPGDAGERDEAQDGGKAIGLGGAIDVAEKTARADPGARTVGVDVDPAHPRHVHRQPAVGERSSRHIVASTLDRQQDAVGAGEGDRLLHLADRDRLDDEGGAARHHPVPDGRRLFVADLAAPEHPSLELRRQGVDCSLAHVHWLAVEARHPKHRHGRNVRSTAVRRIGRFPTFVARPSRWTPARRRARPAIGYRACGRCGPGWPPRSWH